LQAPLQNQEIVITVQNDEERLALSNVYFKSLETLFHSRAIFLRIPRLVVKIAKHDSFVGELFGLVGVETFKLVGLGHVLVLAEVGLVLSRVHKFNGGMVCDRHPSNRVQM